MTEWIDINIELPPQNKLVLLSNNLDGVFRGYRVGDDENYCFQCSPLGSYASDGCVFDITHWAELPQPPMPPAANRSTNKD